MKFRRMKDSSHSGVLKASLEGNLAAAQCPSQDLSVAAGARFAHELDHLKP